jgi:hypothetical protein
MNIVTLGAVMSMVDNVLEGNEPFLQFLAEEQGPLIADQYMREYNNACCQFAGFEEFYRRVVNRDVHVDGFFAPKPSLSQMEH